MGSLIDVWDVLAIVGVLTVAAGLYGLFGVWVALMFVGAWLILFGISGSRRKAMRLMERQGVDGSK